MADKSFGVKQLNLIGASGTPTVESPNDLNLVANVVAISSNLTVNNDISVVGIVTATDFNSLSDISKKINILPVDNALKITSELGGVRFNWKESGNPSIGVIAQEVEKVLPELVSTGEYKTVNYNGIIGVLIEAIKELKSEIEELKKKINS